jgi:hypothetical protein
MLHTPLVPAYEAFPAKLPQVVSDNFEEPSTLMIEETRDEYIEKT